MASNSIQRTRFTSSASRKWVINKSYRRAYKSGNYLHQKQSSISLQTIEELFEQLESSVRVFVSRIETFAVIGLSLNFPVSG